MTLKREKERQREIERDREMGRERDIGEGRERGGVLGRERERERGFWFWQRERERSKKNGEEKWGKRRLFGLKTDNLPIVIAKNLNDVVLFLSRLFATTCHRK